MSYFEVNGLQVRHKTSEGVKEVLNIEHIAIEKEQHTALSAKADRENRPCAYDS